MKNAEASLAICLAVATQFGPAKRAYPFCGQRRTESVYAAHMSHNKLNRIQREQRTEKRKPLLLEGRRFARATPHSSFTGKVPRLAVCGHLKQSN